MFAELPKLLQEKVLEYLQDNNFPAAKALYDEHHRQQQQQSLNAVIKSKAPRKPHPRNYAKNSPQ